MEIQYDPAKDASNIAKHGFSLAAAIGIFADPNLVIFPDTRRAYGEARFIAMGVLGGRIYSVAYTMRGDHYRIISLRKANSREQARYRRHQA